MHLEKSVQQTRGKVEMDCDILEGDVPIFITWRHFVCCSWCTNMLSVHFSLHVNAYFTHQYWKIVLGDHIAFVCCVWIAEKTANFIFIFPSHSVSLPLRPCSPTRAMASSFLMRYLDHTQRRTTVGRTPLDEWSARRRVLYLTTHNTHNRHPCPRWDSNPQSQQASGRRSTP